MTERDLWISVFVAIILGGCGVLAIVLIDRYFISLGRLTFPKILGALIVAGSIALVLTGCGSPASNTEAQSYPPGYFQTTYPSTPVATTILSEEPDGTPEPTDIQHVPSWCYAKTTVVEKSPSCQPLLTTTPVTPNDSSDEAPAP